MKKITVASVVLLMVIVLGVLGVIFRQEARMAVGVAAAQISQPDHEPFPASDTAQLSPLQTKILDIAKAEYAQHPVSYDQRVLQYTQGSREAWCADFISWAMQQAGAPLANPHSGGWRIPGVLTLQEYYQAQGRYMAAGNYTPRQGDVAFFIGPRTYDLASQQHAALVVAVQGDTMTTLGGNERGRMRLNTQLIKPGERSLAGFGTLEDR